MPVPHIPTHIQSTGIRVVKSSVSAAQCITKCLCNGGVMCKLLVFYLRSTFGHGGQIRFQSPPLHKHSRCKQLGRLRKTSTTGLFKFLETGEQ